MKKLLNIFLVKRVYRIVRFIEEDEDYLVIDRYDRKTGVFIGRKIIDKI